MHLRTELKYVEIDIDVSSSFSVEIVIILTHKKTSSSQVRSL